MSRRLGLLGPLLVLVGAVVAAGGIWWMNRARSHAGPFVDVLALDGETALAVRGERASSRAFLELRRFSGEVAWQAMVPPYAGRPGAPGLAASRDAASVRVVRDGGAEVFGMSMRNASKLGGFKLAADRPRDPHGHTLPAAVTLTDLRSSFELVGQEASNRSPRQGAEAGAADAPGWAALAAVDLATGRKQWDTSLGAEPVLAAGIAEGVVWIQQGGQLRGFRASDGVPVVVPPGVTPPAAAGLVRTLLSDGALRVEFDRKARELRVHRGEELVLHHPWPAGALEPWPYHLAGGRLWIVSPDRIDTLVVLPSPPH